MPRRGSPTVATGVSPWIMVHTIIWITDPGGVDQFRVELTFMVDPSRVGDPGLWQCFRSTGCTPVATVGTPLKGSESLLPPQD
ncbi:MAG: hypothetical protein HY913_08100 [Desulfomonile tiedjei]|nr:hypothetical protein [Desulfomonile tiedjei]